jgi:hypothetical protein
MSESEAEPLLLLLIRRLIMVHSSEIHHERARLTTKYLKRRRKKEIFEEKKNQLANELSHTHAETETETQKQKHTNTPLVSRKPTANERKRDIRCFLFKKKKKVEGRRKIFGKKNLFPFWRKTTCVISN